MLKDFTKIDTFLTVVKEKSFSKASKKLGISQPAVTQQIKIIEDYLGTQIVDRKKNGIKLTKEGEEFYKIVNRLERCVLNAERDVIKIINKEIVFVIGASFMIGNYILPDFLTEIQGAIKNDVMIKVDSVSNITEELLDKKVDLALLESPKFNDEIVYKEWMDDELVLVSKTPLPKYINPGELNNFSWICREDSSNTRQIIKQEFEKIGVDCDSFDLRSVVTSSTAAKQTILKSPIVDGVPTVTIISKHMVEDRITNKELHYARVKGIKLTRKLYIAHLKEKKSDPFMDNVINYITSKKKI
ncbi:LysR family transcriptional regulator [Sulfurospirillum sp. 1307]